MLRPLLVAALLFSAAGGVAFADVVTDWNAMLEVAMRNPTPAPFVQFRCAAIVHAAIFDAVNGVSRKYVPLRVTDLAPAGARADAAAVQAAYVTLVSLFPTKQAAFDAQLATSLAQISDNESNSPSIALGRAWGESVAQQILAWRAADGFTQVLTYTGSSAAGQWRHAPNAAGPAVGLNVAATIPFALTDLASFDPGPPYGTNDRAAALASAAYAVDLNEVKARGGAVSAVRTPAQTDLALFFDTFDLADLNATVRRLTPRSSKLVDNARIFALLNISAIDAAIVAFQGKYKYGLWRPYQAIPFADEDGNTATIPDPTWVPLGATPPFPEYLSGHALVSTAMLGVLAAIFGDDTSVTLITSNPGAPAITPTFSSFSAYSNAVTEARINIGFHFRTACSVGQMTGYAIASQIVRTALRPLPSSGVINLSLRGRAGSGAETLIAGFVVDTGSRQLLIRGLGPALVSFGMTNVLADPKIILYDGSGRIIAENDNWSSGGSTMSTALAAASDKAGAFPLLANSLDAALLAILTPGSYSVHVSGASGASGLTLIEAYEVP